MPNNKHKILVIGSGGREHAIVKACLASPLASSVTAAPGNGGMALEVPCLPVERDNPESIAALAKAEKAEFVITGPEAPLCAGAADALEAAGIPAFGPSKPGAMLEGSKAFAKCFLLKYGIPTARAGVFSKALLPAALDYLKEQTYPLVVKASGLAEGKGVLIAQNQAEAEETVRDMMEKDRFGASGREVVIEECLEGEEASITLMVCGKKYVSLPPSQDHKRAGENDTGPNTGGMGAYAPAALVTPPIQRQITSEIIEPVLEGLITEGMDYRGALYIGVMLTQDGPKVLEFNVRLGDPETQVLLPLLETDPLELMIACAKGALEPSEIRVKPRHAITIVLASKGYPGSYPKGEKISLPQTLPENVSIIHAGTKKEEDGSILTNGGRVLNVTALGPSLQAAADAAYQACENIRWPSKYCRRDIGARQLRREK